MFELISSYCSNTVIQEPKNTDYYVVKDYRKIEIESGKPTLASGPCEDEDYMVPQRLKDPKVFVLDPNLAQVFDTSEKFVWAW